MRGGRGGISKAQFIWLNKGLEWGDKAPCLFEEGLPTLSGEY